MPDIGKWNGIDQLAEDYLSASPYAYVLNNPINMFDPDGRETAPWQAMWEATPEGTNSYWFNNGNGGFTSYAGGPKGGGLGGGGGSLAYGSTVSYGGLFTMGDGVYILPPLVLSGYGSAKHWGGAISTYNINHGILYNGIAGMQSAWNRAMFDAYRPLTMSEIGGGGLQDVNILAVPYMLVEAGLTEGLMRVGMDGNSAHSTAQLATFLYAMKAPQGVSGEMGIINKGAMRIDPKNLAKGVTNDFTEILAGRGTPIMRNGAQAITENRSGINKNWVGASEWKITDVPGTRLNGSRIVQHPSGKWGLVTNHDYTKIIQIPTSSAVKWK